LKLRSKINLLLSLGLGRRREKKDRRREKVGEGRIRDGKEEKKLKEE
jgi:hypothetical protein